jgi:pyridoxine/pyridoxamine 5'-phosphate oxidase
MWLDALELWVEGTDRFHERLRYRREISMSTEHAFRTGPWSWQRLQP